MITPLRFFPRGFIRVVYYNTFFLQRAYIYDKRYKMKGKRWDDHYTRRARKEKWLARSVYKLQELDRKFHLIHMGDRILDLGCYPGSWSQYGIKKVGPGGEVIGVDVTPPERVRLPNFGFIRADVFSLETERLAERFGRMDVVMSDLAPKTTGISVTDACQSMDLAVTAEKIAIAVLRKEGNFLCKVFEGEDLSAFRSELSNYFSRVRMYRTKATRKRSREVYVLGLGFTGK